MYASTEELEARLDPAHLVELADDDQDGLPDTPVLEAALADADAVIDAHLAARYRLPLSAPPPLLRRLAVDLAAAQLFARRREADSPLHAARGRDALALLAEIERGTLALADCPRRPGLDLPDSSTLGLERRFTRESLSDY